MLAQLQARVARSLISLPYDVARRMAGKPTVTEGHTLHPAFQLLLRAQRATRRPPFEALGLEGARNEYRALVNQILSQPEPPSARTRDIQIERVPVRLHHPSPNRRVPLVVYFHGGGWVIGGLATHDAFCRRLCRTAGVAVAAVDYRLAPEHPFPAAVEDCLIATQGLRDSASDYDLDASKVALAGDSAGGNLAAVVSQALGAAVEGVAYQLLYYPGIDATSTNASKELFSKGFGLDASTRDWMLGSYAPGVSLRDPRLSPLYGDHSMAPPTRLVTGAFDPLRDEALAYADALEAAAVPVERIVRSGFIHGFIHATRIPAVRASIDEDALRVREVLHSS